MSKYRTCYVLTKLCMRMKFGIVYFLCFFRERDKLLEIIYQIGCGDINFLAGKFHRKKIETYGNERASYYFCRMCFFRTLVFQSRSKMVSISHFDLKTEACNVCELSRSNKENLTPSLHFLPVKIR